MERTMMMDLLSDPTVKAGLALLVLIVLSTVAFFLVARLRDYTAQDWDSSPDTLSNFEEMRLKGEISEKEFRTIQAATSTSTKADTAESTEHPSDDPVDENDSASKDNPRSNQ